MLCTTCTSQSTGSFGIGNVEFHLGGRKKQKENQEDLLKRVNEETLRQLRHTQDDGNQNGSDGGRQVSEVVAYRSIAEMPTVRDLAIQASKSI